MKLNELKEKLELKNITEYFDGDREITGCYIGDLLSWVMSRAQEGNVWITVQTNINILAVASLTDCACIIIPENIELDSNTVKKADMQNITILGSSKTGYELAKLI